MSTMQDKTQFGLTKEGTAVIERLEELAIFPNQMEAAKFALAVAIRSGAKPSVVAQAKTTWHAGGFDPDHELADVVCILFPEVQAPYRAIEALVNDGLALLGKEIERTGTLDLPTLVDVLPNRAR